MNCRDAQACLPGYLDGAIRSRERAMLRAHLESCTDCREQLSHYRLLATHLANVAPVESPAELVAPDSLSSVAGAFSLGFCHPAMVARPADLSKYS